MAYAKSFIQLTWGGSYFNDDIWINGLHIIHGGVVPGDWTSSIFDQGLVNSFVNPITAAHTAEQGNSNKALLEWVKIARIDTNGKYIGDAIIQDVTAVPGGRVSDMYPQLATAVTLRGDKKRGPAAYGRYYAPFALPVASNGHSTSSDVSAALNRQQNMLTAINASLANVDALNLTYIGNVSKVGSGSQERVTGVFMGDITDTQRRRRNKLSENYTGQTVG